MIILDTNVISELVNGPQASPQVLAWVGSLDEQPVTTVVNRAEVLLGLALMPAGKRQRNLTDAADRAFNTLAACLPLTAEGADAYADIVATRRATGRPIGTMDALIAAIAHVTRAKIATRDIDGFDGLGLTLVDPWAS